nr:CNT_HP1_G0014950.mRNA.1.CDS.1 [Saccharomyces cerevisiae]
MLGTWPLLEEEKQLVYWIRQEASKGAKFSACLEGRSKSCIIKYGATCVNRRQRCCSDLLNWDEKSAGKNGRQKTDTVFVEALEKVGVFQRLRSMTRAGLQGPQNWEYLLEQISEVWLLPHWVDLANVEVLAADNTRVPLYMLMVAVHKELDSDDVPDGRFDNIIM